MEFKSYCWSLGTTSFRVKDLNLKIEKQLNMLSELWLNNPKSLWKELQEEYYDLMKKEEFVKGDAKNKAKDGREKTSGLVDIGLLTKDRKLTEVGKRITNIVMMEDYNKNNIFNISNDSYVYLKQLLKHQTTGGSKDFKIKPFIILIKAIIELEYVSSDEFTYLLPLCTETKDIYITIEDINNFRDGKLTIDEVIEKKILNMNNYNQCLQYMNNNDMTDIDEFAKVELNRKGGKYSKPYCDFYNNLLKIKDNTQLSESEVEMIVNFLKQETKKNSKTSKSWREYFSYSANLSWEELSENILKSRIFSGLDIIEFNKEFFLLMHRAKWKATLMDYSDLNKRYFSLSDILIFDSEKIELDLLPKYYFKDIIDELVETEFLIDDDYDKFIQKDIKFEEIYDCLSKNVKEVIEKVNIDYPEANITISTIGTFIKDERLRRFNKLIDLKFNSEQLIDLFNKYENKRLNDISSYTDWTADIPTIFEYILAIAWYRISEKENNILDSMRLTLDANLYPKTHAAGGGADIVYMYKKSAAYPEHTVLLEATLTESTNQRKNEMEPVSRHMMRYIQETDEESAYVVFVANYLNEEVLSDFRHRKTLQYRAKDRSVKIGLKIIPLSTSDISKILKTNTNYKGLYKLFDRAYLDNECNDLDWYGMLIKEPIQNIIGI